MAPEVTLQAGSTFVGDSRHTMIEGQSLFARSLEILRADPAEFGRLVIGKARRVKRPPSEPVVGRIGDVRFEFDFGLGSSTVSMMWRRTYQPEIAIAMRRYLRKGSTFVDVGANVGYFSAIGADLVGSRGSVIAFEPVPQYADRLMRLKRLNPDFDINVHPVAVGDARRTVEMFVNEGDNFGVNSVMREAVPHPSEPVVVDVVRLDASLPARVDLVKMDIEGFEILGLRGLGDCLPAIGMPPILCEFSPRHYAALGVTLHDAHEWLSSVRYRAREVLIDRPVDLRGLESLHDVLLVPMGRPPT